MARKIQMSKAKPSSDNKIEEKNKDLQFDISASVVRQLGEELISDEVTALVELAKNSWDADADWIHIEVETKDALDKSSGSNFAGAKTHITLRDNGDGMSLSDIEQGWLTISRSKKSGMKARGEKTRKLRTPLGDKGLGRLSTQRLGHNIDLLTKMTGGPGHHVSFSWKEFTDDSVLTEVPITHLPCEKTEKGTTLIISDLRDPLVWNKKGIERLRVRLSQLIFPFQSVRPFSVYLKVNGETIDLVGVADSIRESAPCKYKFNFDDDELVFSGKISLSKLKSGSGRQPEIEEQFEHYLGTDNGADFFAFLQQSKNRIEGAKYLGGEGGFLYFSNTIRIQDAGAELDENNIPASPGAFEGEIFEYILKGSDQNVFDSQSEFNAYVKEHSGIRIFRDGFGIRPYGYDRNDWLALGGGATSNTSYYGMRPSNVIGYVSLSEEHNSLLKEKTDREGFVQNAYSENLIKLMKECVKRINKNLENLRRGYNEYRTKRSTLNTGLKTIEQNLDEVRKVGTESLRLLKQTTSALEKVESASLKAHELTRKVTETPLFSKAQDRQAAQILSATNDALDTAKGILGEVGLLLNKAAKVSDISDFLRPKIEIYQSQIQDLTELAALGLTAEALTHELEAVSSRIQHQTSNARKSAKSQSVNEIWLNTYFEEISTAVSAIRKQLAHLAPTLRYVRETRQGISVAQFCKDIAKFFKSQLSTDSVLIKVDSSGSDFLVELNRGRLTQVVDNVVLNCQYWVKKAKDEGLIEQPKIILEYDMPVIRIFDNGEGVDNSVEEGLFEPFVSMKPNNEGRGLGLFIAQQLLEPMGSEITLLHKRNSFGRRHIFQIDLSGVLKKNDE